MTTYITIALMLVYSMCYSQEDNKENVIKISSVTESEAFDKTLERLIESPYFVEFADKESRILQCKFMLKDRRLLAGKIGDIIHYNVLFRSTSDEGTLVYIQANRIEKSKSGSVEVSDYYNDDLGITRDRKFIDPLFEFIKNGFNK